MAVSRIVNTSFWTDSKVSDMTPEDRYFMLYLLTNPQTSQLGIYELNRKRAAFEMGYSIEAVVSLLDRFENKYGIIKCSKTTNEIAIKNYLIYSIIKGGKPVLDCLEKELKQVKDTSLISYIFSYLHNKQNLNETVKLFINNNINNYHTYENINDNDNDNDNDVSSRRYVHESSTNRPRIVHESLEDEKPKRVRKKKEFTPPTLDEVKAYAISRNSIVDPVKFFDYYNAGNWVDSKGEPVRNWKQKFITWEGRDKDKHSSPNNQKQSKIAQSQKVLEMWKNECGN